MTVKTKLLLGTLVCIVLAVTCGGFFAWSAWQAAEARRSETRATDIVDATSQLRSLTFEYLLTHEQAPLQQWHVESSKLDKLMQPPAYFDRTERHSLAATTQLAQQNAQLFRQIVDTVNMPIAAQDPSAQTVVQDYLVTQLLLKQQTQVTEALKMAAHAQAMTATYDQRTSIFGMSVVSVMLLIGAINYLFVTHIITTSLKELQKGAEAIARGRFTYRITPRNRRDEFGRVATAFNIMALKTGQIDKEKTEFIFLASHQLRTPLTAMRWYAEALADPRANLDSPKQKAYVRQVLRSSERMIDLVDKLLDAARAEADSLHSQPEQIDLRNVLEQVIQDVGQEIRANNVQVETQIAANVPELTIDPSWIRIILENLLSNAARYSHYGERVVVHVTRAGEFVSISVADTGYGIPVREQNRVFTKLFRADNAKQIIGEGSGIGLYIAKAMVDRAGGKITFTSTENKGTTFVVTLPLHYTPPPSSARKRQFSEAAASPADQPANAISLDKQSDFMSLVAHQLRTLPNIIGWDVESLLDDGGFSRTGRKALEHVLEVNRRMLALIDTMLNISRVELGTLSITPARFDLRTSVEEELAVARQVSKRKGPRLIADFPKGACMIDTDKSVLQIILQNLLSNAAKYTPADGTVTIAIKKRAQAYHIQVADTGYGIPEHEQARVFSKLFRADNVRSGNIVGNGLGLYLTKQLVELLHGTISFTSAENRGTTFTVELPLSGVHKQDGSTKLSVSGLPPETHKQGGVL